MAGRKYGDNAVIATFVLDEYGTNVGNELGSGNGCANGNCRLAAAFDVPVLIRVVEKGAARTERMAV
jgi:hypothetical protein